MRLLLAAILVWAGVAHAQEPLPAPYEAALRDLRANRDGVARAWAAVGLAQGLRTAPAPGAHPRIIEGLRESVTLDPDPTVRAMAAYGLCVLGEAAGVPPLVDVLKRLAAEGRDARDYFDARVTVPVSYLYRALGVAGGRLAREFLVATATGGTERGARVVAVSVFESAWTGDPEIDTLLRHLLTDREPGVRGAATWAIESRQRNRKTLPAR